MTPEGHVKEGVKRELKRIGAFYHMPVQNGMGEPTVDFVCCLRGRGFLIEAKAPGGKLTMRQEITFQRYQAAGGATFLIDGSEQSYNEFRLWVVNT